MSFRDRLLEKLAVDALAGEVAASIGPSGSDRRIDKEKTRQLIGRLGLERLERRDLEMYLLPVAGERDRVLVLDNDLPIYNTTPEDVTLRKSPIVKEMVNLRNIIRILNDKDVVVSKKEASVDTLHREAVGRLDLSYTADDIHEMAADGVEALKNGYQEGVLETLALFAELLGLQAPPRPMVFSHHDIRGLPVSGARGPAYSPVIIYSRFNNTLKMINGPVAANDPAAFEQVKQLVKGKTAPDAEGADVFDRLDKMAQEADYPPPG